jgi:hypothetical protein
MIWRLAVVLAVVAAAWVAVRIWERRPVGSSLSLPLGLTLVTGADCRLCPLAVDAASGAEIPLSIIDVAKLADPAIKSLPTALVADRRGTIVARRSGRSAITGMPELIALARSVA